MAILIQHKAMLIVKVENLRGLRDKVVVVYTFGQMMSSIMEGKDDMGLNSCEGSGCLQGKRNGKSSGKSSVHRVWIGNLDPNLIYRIEI